MITVLLSLFAAAALALTACDALEGANTTGKRRRAKIAAVVGVLAIGIQCWQTLKAGDEPRQRMIEAIAAEQIANLQRMDSWSRPEEQDKANVALTELQSAAVKGVIASALFAANADNALLEALTRMNELVDDFNKRIRKTAENMWGDRGGTSIEWRRKLKDSPSYRTTKEQATSLLALLVKQYGLDPKRQFFGTQEPKEGERGGASTK